MQEDLYKCRQAVKVTQLLLCGLVLGVLPAKLSGQGVPAKGPHCFIINVRLNGQAIEGPQSVTLKTRTVENTVPLGQSCFQVPAAIVESELLEVSFTLPGNQIHMSDIPTDFLTGMWDVELADKKFGKDVVVPKHANASEVCAVVFRGGDQTQSLAQPQCRTPLAGK